MEWVSRVLFALQASSEEVVVKALKYSACVDVIDSDHKPVWVLLALDVPVTNQEKKRRMCSHILKQAAAQGQAPDRPALQASCDSIQLNQVQSVGPNIESFKLNLFLSFGPVPLSSTTLNIPLSCTGLHCNGTDVLLTLKEEPGTINTTPIPEALCLYLSSINKSHGS